jgi:hypothetical protein
MARLRKILVEGEWYAQAPDGSWLRWNGSRNDWENYPIPPPGFSQDVRLDGRESGGLPEPKRPLSSEIFTVYGFLLGVSVCAVAVAAAVNSVVSALGGNPIEQRLFLVEVSIFLWGWVTLLGIAAVYLRRSREHGWVLRMMVVALLVAAGILMFGGTLQVGQVRPALIQLGGAWAVLVMLGLIWRKFEEREKERSAYEIWDPSSWRRAPVRGRSSGKHRLDRGN